MQTKKHVSFLTLFFYFISTTRSTSVEIRSLLLRLQRLETTLAHLAGTATEITEKRESTVAATHQQIVNNHELLQQVCAIIGFLYCVLDNFLATCHFLFSLPAGSISAIAYERPQTGKWAFSGGTVGARGTSRTIGVD